MENHSRALRVTRHARAGSARLHFSWAGRRACCGAALWGELRFVGGWTDEPEDFHERQRVPGRKALGVIVEIDVNIASLSKPLTHSRGPALQLAAIVVRRIG